MVFTDGSFQELRMEIAKQELIVQAREAASRVLRALSGAWGSGPPPAVLSSPPPRLPAAGNTASPISTRPADV